MTTEENLEPRWLTIFVFGCPNCGRAALDYLYPAIELTQANINETQLGQRECERCHVRYRPDARTSQKMTIPWNQKRDFESYTQDK